MNSNFNVQNTIAYRIESLLMGIALASICYIFAFVNRKINQNINIKKICEASLYQWHHRATANSCAWNLATFFFKRGEHSPAAPTLRALYSQVQGSIIIACHLWSAGFSSVTNSPCGRLVRRECGRSHALPLHVSLMKRQGRSSRTVLCVNVLGESYVTVVATVFVKVRREEFYSFTIPHEKTET